MSTKDEHGPKTMASTFDLPIALALDGMTLSLNQEGWICNDVAIGKHLEEITQLRAELNALQDLRRQQEKSLKSKDLDLAQLRKLLDDAQHRFELSEARHKDFQQQISHLQKINDDLASRSIASEERLGHMRAENGKLEEMIKKWMEEKELERQAKEALAEEVGREKERLIHALEASSQEIKERETHALSLQRQLEQKDSEYLQLRESYEKQVEAARVAQREKEETEQRVQLEKEGQVETLRENLRQQEEKNSGEIQRLQRLLSDCQEALKTESNLREMAHESHQALLDSLKSQQLSYRTIAEEERLQLELQKRGLEEVLSTLRQQLEEKEKAEASLRHEAHDREVAITSIRRQVQELEDSKSAEVTRLQQQLQDKDARLTSLSERVEQMSRQQEAKEEQIASLSQALHEARRKAEAKETEQHAINESDANLLRFREEASRREAILVREVERLQADRERLSVSLSSSTQKLSLLQTALEEKDVQNNDLALKCDVMLELIAEITLEEERTGRHDIMDLLQNKEKSFQADKETKPSAASYYASSSPGPPMPILPMESTRAATAVEPVVRIQRYDKTVSKREEEPQRGESQGWWWKQESNNQADDYLFEEES